MRSYETLAKMALFSKTTFAELLGDEFELRKGKTYQDLKRAILRGRKQGNGRTEHEISMIELQLKSVLKTKAKDKK